MRKNHVKSRINKKRAIRHYDSMFTSLDGIISKLFSKSKLVSKEAETAAKTAEKSDDEKKMIKTIQKLGPITKVLETTIGLAEKTVNKLIVSVNGIAKR